MRAVAAVIAGYNGGGSAALHGTEADRTARPHRPTAPPDRPTAPAAIRRQRADPPAAAHDRSAIIATGAGIRNEAN